MEREREHVGQNLAAGEHRRGERHAATDVLAFTFHVIYAPYGRPAYGLDRKSTRLNSSHEWISYAVFCLKKKRTENILPRNFKRRQVAIQNRVSSNIGISQSTFSVKVLNLFSFFIQRYGNRRDIHSFPTRRSSD